MHVTFDLYQLEGRHESQTCQLSRFARETPGLAHIPPVPPVLLRILTASGLPAGKNLEVRSNRQSSTSRLDSDLASSLASSGTSGVAKAGLAGRARPILSCSSHSQRGKPHCEHRQRKPILRIHSPDYAYIVHVSLYS